MPLLNFYPLLESFLSQARDKQPDEVGKLAEGLKSNYDQKVGETFKKLKEVENYGYEQWMLILGESELEEKFKY